MSVKLILAFYGSLLLAMLYYFQVRAKGRGSRLLTTMLCVGFYGWMLAERAKSYDIESVQNVFIDPNTYSVFLLEALIYIVLVIAIWHLAEGGSAKCAVKRFEQNQNC
jgi:hypothetical protein